MLRVLAFCLCLALVWGCTPSEQPEAARRVLLGNENLISDSLHLLIGKRVALVANHTSRLPRDSVHLVDTLRALGIRVQKVFAPEHGFRGGQQAGDTIHDHCDHRTGLPIISLYGKKDRPSAADLADVDVVVFDIQDVGTRYYTYLATMVWTMQVCAELRIPFVVLDRPNPNADRLAGPVARDVLGSIACLHAVPVLYGLTLGEYAQMVNDEGWLSGGLQAQLHVVPLRHYQRAMQWQHTGLPWWPPSPNLPTAASARHYPVLCWYEGTVVSVGRGTAQPFELVGMPFLDTSRFKLGHHHPLTRALPQEGVHTVVTQFCPMPIPGKADRPMHEGQLCYGFRLVGDESDGRYLFTGGVQLLANMHSYYGDYARHVRQTFPDSVVSFFNPYFERLVGRRDLRRQIEQGISPGAIVASWQPGIDSFALVRKRYLLYR